MSVDFDICPTCNPHKSLIKEGAIFFRMFMKIVFFSVNRSWRQQEARINLRFTNFGRGQKFWGLTPPRDVKSRERVRATFSDANSWSKALCML